MRHRCQLKVNNLRRRGIFTTEGTEYTEVRIILCIKNEKSSVNSGALCGEKSLLN
jgi:hypothetical protein